MTTLQAVVLEIVEDHSPTSVAGIQRRLSGPLEMLRTPHRSTIRRALHALIEDGHDIVWTDGVVYFEPPWSFRTLAADDLREQRKRLLEQIARVYGGRCAYRDCRRRLDPDQRARLTLYCEPGHRFLEAREREKERSE